jgi:hypothetical protein
LSLGTLQNHMSAQSNFYDAISKGL